jgi:hypothetical protein
MTDSFDEYLIDLLSESKATARQYDKLLEGGMATRFVKEMRADGPSDGQ